MTSLLSRRNFLFATVVYHLVLVLFFYLIAYLDGFQPSSLGGTAWQFCVGLFSIFLGIELAKRIDMLFLSYSLHKWMWRVTEFPRLSRTQYLSLRLFLLGLWSVAFIALLTKWQLLPFLARSYFTFILVVMFLGVLDFLICSFGKFSQRLADGTWCANLRMPR